MAKGKDCDKQQAEPMSIHHIITAPPPHVLVHVGQVKLTVVAILMLLLILATDAVVGGDCDKQQAEPMSIHHIIS